MPKVKRNIMQKKRRVVTSIFEINFTSQPGAREMVELMKRLEKNSGVKIAEVCVLEKNKVRLGLTKQKITKRTGIFPQTLIQKRVADSKNVPRQVSVVISK